MSERSIAGLALRGAVLFGMSVVLVLGFWYHQTFYQLGLYSLLLLGGLATLAMLVAGHLAFSGRSLRKRPIGTLGLTLEEGQQVQLRSATLLALPCQATRDLKPGAIVDAKYSHGSSIIARLEIRNNYRKLLSDISEEEVHALGYPSADKFKAAIGAHGKWNPDDIVTLTRFRVVEDDA